MVANRYSDNILVKLFISEIVHTEDSFLLKLYYKFNFATEPIKITLEDQTLRLKGMESVFKKMDELQITSTDKIEIHAVGLEGNEITQSIYINYYHNHGNIRVSGENKIWVEGMYAVLSNRLNKQKDKYFESKYHRGIFKFFPIISGVFLGLGIINLINF